MCCIPATYIRSLSATRQTWRYRPHHRSHHECCRTAQQVCSESHRHVGARPCADIYTPTRVSCHAWLACLCEVASSCIPPRPHYTTETLANLMHAWPGYGTLWSSSACANPVLKRTIKSLGYLRHLGAKAEQSTPTDFYPTLLSDFHQQGHIKAPLSGGLTCQGHIQNQGASAATRLWQANRASSPQDTVHLSCFSTSPNPKRLKPKHASLNRPEGFSIGPRIHGHCFRKVGGMHASS